MTITRLLNACISVTCPSIFNRSHTWYQGPIGPPGEEANEVPDSPGTVGPPGPMRKGKKLNNKTNSYSCGEITRELLGNWEKTRAVKRNASRYITQFGMAVCELRKSQLSNHCLVIHSIILIEQPVMPILIRCLGHPWTRLLWSQPPWRARK